MAEALAISFPSKGETVASMVMGWSRCDQARADGVRHRTSVLSRITVDGSLGTRQTQPFYIFTKE